MNTKLKRWVPVVTAVVCLLILVAPVAAAGNTVHVVQPGETLAQIAARYGTTTTSLVQANGLRNANFIWWGQRLIIPGSGYSTPSTGTSYHTVSYGETLAIIAARYGTSISALARLNGLSNINFVYVGQRLLVYGSAPAPAPAPAPSTGTSYHTVRYGETLAIIAARYGTSISALARLNGLSNINFVYVGQRLLVYGSAPAPAPAPSAPTGNKWILVDLSSQRLTAYVGNTAVRSTLVSTGTYYTPTPTGRYSIIYKVGSTAMSGPGYYLPNVPYVMGFIGQFSMHGTYWHSNFGTPMSHGCVNLPTSEAAWLYSWAPMGTSVVIQW
jgi:LysM repeat protein